MQLFFFNLPFKLKLKSVFFFYFATNVKNSRKTPSISALLFSLLINSSLGVADIEMRTLSLNRSIADISFSLSKARKVPKVRLVSVFDTVIFSAAILIARYFITAIFIRIAVRQIVERISE